MAMWSDEPDDPDRPVLKVVHIGREAPAVADLGRWCAALADRVAALETLLADERRELARLRSVAVPRARKASILWIPLAWLGIAWGGHCGSYAYEPAKEATDGQAADRD